MEVLTGDERIKQVARVANRFHLDPVDLLRDDGDEWEMTVRIACADIIAEDERREAEEQERRVKKK